MDRVFKTGFYPVDSDTAPKAKASLSTAQTIAASGTATVQFDTEAFDVGGNFASHKFTAPSAGYYLVVVDLDAAAALDVKIKVAGSAKEQVSGSEVNMSGVHYLSASDTVEVEVTNQDAVNTVDVTAGSSLAVVKLA